METIISGNLKRLRKVKELTQCELAKLSGVSQGEISKIEAGGRIPKVAIIQKLAKALGQTPESLVKGAIERAEEDGEVEFLIKMLDIQTAVAREALDGWEKSLNSRGSSWFATFFLGVVVGIASLMFIVGLLS